MTQLPNIHFVIENVRAMAETEGVDKQQAALNAMTAILGDLEDYGPYNVLTALLSHLTFAQPDRVESLRFIVNGVLACWQNAISGIESTDVWEAMDERNKLDKDSLN